MTPEDAEPLELLDLVSERRPDSAVLALSLGGDGTMLRTVKMLGGSGVPIIGVNVGLLGYLTEVEPPALTAALERWDAGSDTGEWRIEERMMLDATLRRSGADHGTPEMWTALNEAVIEKQEAGHTVRLLVRIDGATFTSYAADGLIIATPTGSTAYSLSARGPVVSPKHRALLLTPVSPHMLFDRSLVLDPDEEVEIEVIGDRAATLSIDGQSATSLAEGDTVVVRASASVARFVRFGERRFHQILKTKFGLSDR
jgi:NAD+ kinase